MNTRENIRRPWRIAAAVLLFAAAVAGGLHLYATSLAEKARGDAPTGTRLSAAERATRIEPWNERFAVTHVIVEAQDLLGRGKVDEAYFTLLPLSKTVRGDKLFRETYQATLAAKWPLDARKAHQQHAREQKNGALDERDVWK